jgi:hypothetical protein
MGIEQPIATRGTLVAASVEAIQRGQRKVGKKQQLVRAMRGPPLERAKRIGRIL